ncbi:ParB/RepB/Spo0J family partition protein [Azohydromonas caseinilytica]|uniref:ParB/RepB/Spo0J family partition protein n=1 Tax=Azohydromonas caseinilytica TaxID=2728836 RepID=A0A848FD48_9BURK|nr:ParB/RepB/Spo0J family partition protein [Azohydromonas caseinilytica]NML18137.1 ParB/RepB/Spo0J family partition protein [Azohydromonas caseinilytica]
MATRKKGHDIDWSNVPRRSAAVPDGAADPGMTPQAAPAPAIAAAAPVSAAAAAPPVAKPRTGPGYNALQIFTGNALQERIAELEEEVRRVSEQRGAVVLDARIIRASRWANRHEASFTGKAYDELKAEIKDAGGNVQPIMVRPVAGAKEGGAAYEVVFGHRRHRACLELGLPVQAVVKDVGDRELFGFMERENRVRRNLSAYEQGAMYRRALDEGLFPSLRQLATHVGRDHGDISKAMRIASLPQEVVNAFASPNDIQFRWASVLAEAVERDRDAVLRVAADPLLKELPPRRIFEALAGRGRARSSTAAEGHGESAATPSTVLPHSFDLGKGQRLAVRSENGRTVLELDAALLPPERWEDIAVELRKLLLPR